jgi:PAS domain S-box-containing protein
MAEREVRDAKEMLEGKSEELRQLGELFRVTLSSVSDAVITTDAEGRVTFINPAAETMTGWGGADALGLELRKIFQIIDEKTRQPAPDPVSKALREGRAVGVANQTTLLAKGGTETAIENGAEPIRDAAGRIVGAVMIFRHATDKRQTSEALREESRALEILNRTGAAIAAQVDLETLVQTVTDAATEVSGAEFGAFFYSITDENGDAFLLYSLSGAERAKFEHFGHPRATALFGPTFQGAPAIRIDDVLADPRYGLWAPHHGMPKGHLPVRSYLAVPVISRSGGVIGGLFFGHSATGVFTERGERIVSGIAAQAAIAIDNARLYEAAQQEIANRHRAEEALRRADRRKDDFLATLAHELRNPLAPIRQAATLSNAPNASEAQKRWSYDVIDRQLRHMSLLLDDLLDVSRITRGKLALRKVWKPLASIIDAALETARPLLDARRHQLTVDLPQEPLHLEADPLRLAQVLSNLLTNAAKYTEPQGSIVLAARSVEDEIVISVTDSGIGIDREMLPRIFEMFSQTTSAIDRAEGGLGIGLALVRGLVSLHGGSVEATSDGAGRGSVFTVRLPVVGAAAAQMALLEPEPATAKAARARASRKILVADDNRDTADSLALFLRLSGHEVEVAYDGEAACSVFETSRPEFVVLDIGMPKLNGYEAARRIRAMSAGESVTLIALTGWGQNKDKRRAIKSGFDHHFTKPLDPGQLAALL